MTQKERILQAFKEHGGAMTLGQLLEDGRYTFAHKLTARLSDLRQDGYKIICTEGPNPSQNLYQLIEPVRFEVETSGQMRFA